jgi:TPP-dependent pyruvate/acetoin dehydrogenase alpha subunit
MEPELKIKMYELMLKVRRFEETIEKLFKAGEMPGFVHLSVGQEAISVGTCLALKEQDLVTSHHRGHGYCIARGVDTRFMMAELFGKAGGLQGGKGGSLHICDFNRGIMGSYAIVGGSIPIATGIGLACQRRELNSIVVCPFGDGAVNSGAFHEAINMASIWKLPVVYLCENNQWAVSTPVAAVINVKNTSERAKAYGIPGVTIDGNDIMAVYETMSQAAQRARSGDGPSLIEAKTFRIAGHFVGDPEHTRNTKEVEKWRKKCPIKRWQKVLTDEGVLNSSNIEKIESQIQAELENAVKYAKELPYPMPSEALKNIFSGDNHE